MPGTNANEMTAKDAALFWLSHCKQGGMQPLSAVYRAFSEWVWKSCAPRLTKPEFRRLVQQIFERTWTPSRNPAVEITLPEQTVPLLDFPVKPMRRKRARVEDKDDSVEVWLRTSCSFSGFSTLSVLYASYLETTGGETVRRAAFGAKLAKYKAWSKQRNPGFALTVVSGR